MSYGLQRGVGGREDRRRGGNERDTDTRNKIVEIDERVSYDFWSFVV